jgi:NADH-quinone oxidoreductase subunit L
MAIPVLILTGVTLVLGFLEAPLRDFLSGGAANQPEAGHAWLAYAGAGLAVLGAGVAWAEFGRRKGLKVGFAERIPAMKELFAQRWYLDHLYRGIVEVIIDRGFSKACARNEERVINDSIDGFCRFTLGSGRFFALLQSGKLRYNLLVMFAAMALVALYFLLA